MTHVYKDFDCDVHFPDFDKTVFKEIRSEENHVHLKQNHPFFPWPNVYIRQCFLFNDELGCLQINKFVVKLDMINRPFSSYPWPLHQNKSLCELIHENVFYLEVHFHGNQTHFHLKSLHENSF